MSVVTVSSEQGTELVVNGLRFSAEVLGFLAPSSGEWRGPLWIRVSGDVAEITTEDPNRDESTERRQAEADGEWIEGFKIGDGT